MRTVHKAELLMPGLFNNLTDEVDLSGRTVEQLAADVDLCVFGIKTFRRVEGNVIVDGKSVRVSSDNFDCSGITYIDGLIMNVNEVKKDVPHNRILLLDIERHGWDRVIRTRAGSFKPFQNGDRNIALAPRQGNG